jgi:hypothetical protein
MYLILQVPNCKYGVCTEGEGSSERSGRTLALRMCGWQTGQQAGTGGSTKLLSS